MDEQYLKQTSRLPEMERQDLRTADFPDGRELIGKEEGFVIGARGEELMRFDTDAHFVSMAKTGAGKGVGVIIPNLLVHPNSIFSIEIGGNTLKHTINFRRELLEQKTFVFDPHGITGEKCAHFNILDTLEPYPEDPDKDCFEADVAEIVSSIMQDSTGKRASEVYFDVNPGNLLKALIIYAKTSPMVREEDRNLPYVADLLSLYGSPAWNELMFVLSQDSSPRFKRFFNPVGNFYNNKDSNITRDGVVTTASGWMEFARDSAFAKMMRSSDFQLSNLRNDKISIYVVMKDAKKFITYNAWMRLMIERAIDACPNFGDGGKDFRYGDRILFMIDEFTQLGKLSCVEEGMQTVRQKGITIWTAFQDYSRLKEVYGENVADSFLGAAACIQAFGVGSKATAEYISERAGNSIVMIPSVSQTKGSSSTSTQNKGFSLANGEQFSVRDGTSRGNTVNWSKSRSHTVAQSVGEAFSVGGGTSSTFFQLFPTNSKSWNRQTSVGRTVSDTDTQQDGRAESETTSYDETNGTTTTQTENFGESDASGINEQITLQYTPQYLPRLSPTDVLDLLNSNDSAILFLTNKRPKLHMTIVEKCLSYEDVPFLKRRAKGPDAPQFPLQPEPLPSPEPMPLLAEGDEADLSLPPSPLQKISFDLIPVPSLPAGQSWQTAQTTALKSSTIRPRKFWDESASPGEMRAIEKINLIEEQIQKSNTATLKIQKDISEKIRLVRSYGNAISAAYSEVSGRAKRLKGYQTGIQTFRQHLENFEKRLKHDSQREETLRAHIEEFKEYTEYYYNLRENVWTKLREPAAPNVQEALPFLSYADMKFDHSSPVIPTEAAARNPSLPPKPESMPEVFDFNFPIAPNVKQIVQEARAMIGGSTYSLAEIDKKLEMLYPKSKDEKHMMLMKFMAGPNNVVQDETSVFSAARSGLVNQIYNEVQNAFQKYGDAIKGTNDQLLKGSDDWDGWYQSMRGMAPKLDKAATDNREKRELYNKDLTVLNSKRDTLNFANLVVTGKKAETFCKVASWDIWRRYKKQTEIKNGKLCGQGFSAKPAAELRNAAKDIAFNSQNKLGPT